MNERIKELAKQSLPAFYLTNCPSALEKFAELIVKECAQVGFEAVSNGDLVEDSILTHFGVEE
jgi:hypothetical protein